MLAKAGLGLRFNEHLEGDGPTVFAHACKMGLEGIVSKRRASLYRSGRLAGLAQNEERRCTSGDARSGRGLGEMTGAQADARIEHTALAGLMSARGARQGLEDLDCWHMRFSLRAVWRAAAVPWKL
jgi:bifunctional non-homologous end joining protein LigD